ALGQDLAEQMVRPVTVTQAQNGFSHRLSSTRRPDRSRATRGVAEGPFFSDFSLLKKGPSTPRLRRSGRDDVVAVALRALDLLELPAGAVLAGVVLGHRDQGR